MNLPFLRRAAATGFAAVCALSFFVADAPAVTFNTIHTFTPLAEGNTPYAPLTQGADGRLYGVNTTGGRSNNGTIFSLPLTGGNSNFLTLNTFTQPNQGTTPEGGVVQARDGFFYGTTYTLGSGGYGTLYQCDPSSGKLNILDQFTNGDPGGNPMGALIEGVDGYLYGTAKYGGLDNYGTVFRSTLAAGTATTLAEITGGLAGFYPQSDLIQATDGNFYGTTSQGGTYGYGTFFQVTPAGVFTTLYSFTGGADGGRPLSGVVQGTDGLFYGVCNQGGSYGGGAVFKIASINTTFTLTALYSFVPIVLDGSAPMGKLVQATDGNFYGTTTGGGANGFGTVFKVTSTGGYNQIYSFTDGTDASNPMGGLLLASDGNLYGTTAGTNGESGTIFRVSLGLPSPTPKVRYFLPATMAAVGDTILLQGDNFVGTTAVAFSAASGTVPATSFTVLSKTVVQAVVPTGAVSGTVVVTANGQTGLSVTPLSVGVVTPPVVTPTVSVLASQPLASKVDGSKGKIKLTRANGDNSQPLVVAYKVRASSTAVYGTDYSLNAAGQALNVIGTVTIPAGKASVNIKVVPVKSSAVAPTTTVVFKLSAGDGYILGNKKAVVQIQSNSAGQ